MATKDDEEIMNNTASWDWKAPGDQVVEAIADVLKGYGLVCSLIEDGSDQYIVHIGPEAITTEAWCEARQRYHEE